MQSVIETLTKKLGSAINSAPKQRALPAEVAMVDKLFDTALLTRSDKRQSASGAYVVDPSQRDTVNRQVALALESHANQIAKLNMAAKNRKINKFARQAAQNKVR